MAEPGVTGIVGQRAEQVEPLGAGLAFGPAPLERIGELLAAERRRRLRGAEAEHRIGRRGGGERRPAAVAPVAAGLAVGHQEHREVERERGIDREVQRTSSYSGIEGLDMQDAAVTESMDPIVNHDMENLAQSDLLVVRTRRNMLDGMRAWQKEGKLPAAIDDPGLYSDRWSGHVIVPNNLDMLDVYRNNIPKNVNAAA